MSVMRQHHTQLVTVLASILWLASCSSGTKPTGRPTGDPGPGPTGDTPGDEGPLPFGVLLTTPEAGTDGVPPDTPIAIVFTDSVDGTTAKTQSVWGACEATNTVSVSSDGFVSCAGGTLTLTSDDILVFTATHGLLNPHREYQVNVTTDVTNLEGTPIEQSFTLEPGFAVGYSPCRASDPADSAALGAACVAPSFVDNGDGTITDRANKLLWTKCSLGGDGQLKNGVDFGCDPPATLDDWLDWEDSVAFCEDLVLAGRSDWKLPDLAELLSLLADSGDPAIDTTFFPETSNLWHNTATTNINNLDSNWSVLFGYMDVTGPGYGGKNRPGGMGSAFARCVAGHFETPAPVLNDLRIYYGDPNEIGLFIPNFYTALGEWPVRQGYIGVNGSIGVGGTTVVNALQGPIDLSAAAEVGDYYAFSGLSAGTTYRIIVIAENSAGYSVKDIVSSTDPVAPQLAPLVVSDFTDTSIFLAQPTFTRAGTPAPAVQAWIGLDGTITANGNTIENALQGPYDVSAQGHDFSPLTPNLTYLIFVVAENTAGYSRSGITQHIGRFINNMDGTVTDSRTGLIWRKCLSGQTWDANTDSCVSDPGLYQFCNEFDNDCNGGNDTGLLGPPWLADNGCGTGCTQVGYSSAWKVCDKLRGYEYAGYSGWRVPTVDELLSLESDGNCLDDEAFPNVPTGADGRIVSAESSTMLWFNAVDSICDVRDASGKDDNFWVRCVTTE